MKNITLIFILLCLLFSCGSNPSFDTTTSNSIVNNTTTTSLNGEKESTSIITSTTTSSSTLSSINSTLTPVLKDVDIDVNKEQFKFNQDLKYDDFYDNLNKKNFTLNIEFGNRETYENEEVYTPSIYETLAIDDNIFYHKIDYIEESMYLYDTLEIAKIINNEVHIVLINLRDNSKTFYKIPVEAFYDTFINKFISIPFAYLEKSGNGGFVNSSLALYKTEYGEYLIENNIFILETHNFYYHEEFTNGEVTYYTYSNIGNTKINVDNNIFLNTNYEDYNIRDFEYKGVEYSYYDNEFQADISISYFDLIHVEKGAHIIYPEIFNIPVTTIYFPYYVYNKNFEGYEYNVYFNEDLMYQEDYSYIGEIKTRIGTSRYDAIDFFVENKGVFNYYGTWQ
jgi:hypothetical protein